jgi:large subunit ribosomal protein L46
VLYVLTYSARKGIEANILQSAIRILEQSAGVNMNTWVVGNTPIGHDQRDYREPVTTTSGLKEVGQKTFFMKARIMAGQANLQDNRFGFKDFKWLAKEEVQKEVPGGYWSSVKNMLADR